MDEQARCFNEVMHLANYARDMLLRTRKSLCQFVRYLPALLFLA
jgi:hypothetical protein